MVALFAIALLENKDQFLMVRRIANAPFGGGMYSLVGGKVDAGELGLHAIVREVYEETGLNIAQQNFELVHTFHRRGIESEFIALCFKADISHLPAPTNKEPDKHDDMRFFSINDLPEKMLSGHKQAIQLIQKNIRYSEHGWE